MREVVWLSTMVLATAVIGAMLIGAGVAYDQPEGGGGDISAGGTLATGAQFIAPLDNDPTKPNFAIGDGTTGWFGVTQSIIGIAIDEVERWRFVGLSLDSSVSSGPGMTSRAAGALLPNIMLRNNDADSGLSSPALDQGCVLMGNEFATCWEEGVEAAGEVQILLGECTFANLGTPGNSRVCMCTDCTIDSPCAGAGTGALAKRLNGVWVCN